MVKRIERSMFEKFELFVKELRDALLTPLPGNAAHDTLAPEHRKSLLIENGDISKALLSGVLILLFPDGHGEPTLVLMKRVEYNGVHSGQISFPGGKSENSDIDLYETAYREAEEEIGISNSQYETLGSLTKLYVPPSNFLIFPVVAAMHEYPAFKPDPNEVAEVITVPLRFFLDKTSIGNYDVTTSDHMIFNVPGFMINNKLVWGATAMILSELIVICRNLSLFRNN